MSYKAIVHGNTISSMKAIINACSDRLSISLKAESIEIANKIKQTKGTDELTASVVADIQTLYEDPAIKSALLRSNEFQLLDSAEYYFKNIERIGSSGYTPTEEDVLRSRQMTTGIIETEWDIKDTHFKMVDVGGQRNHRNKWIHCFEGVTAIIFCVALSEYDQYLREDESTNRMHESLALFDSLANSIWFSKTDFIIFFNKMDIFDEKIQRVDLGTCFTDYKGGKDTGVAKEFIKNQFLAKDRSPKGSRKIFPHFTCATDTNNIRVVFFAVRNILLNEVLKKIIV